MTNRLLQRVTHLGDVRRIAPKHERLLGRIVVHLQRAEAVRGAELRFSERVNMRGCRVGQQDVV